MKLGLLLLLIAVLLGGLVGMLVLQDPGYVLVSYGNMALETSFWFALVLLLIVYASVRGILYLFSGTRATSGRLGSWLRKRRGRNAQQQTVQGLLLMAEGRWSEARKVLVGSADEVRSPLINYLNAARAAHEMGDAEGRDDLLRRAHESTPGSRFAVALTQAELQMNGGQWEQCLATLLQLKAEAPRHPQVLAMLCSCYQQLADWQPLIDLLPDLKKNKVMNESELEALQLTAWTSRLRGARGGVLELWRKLPKDKKRLSVLVGAAAESLLDAGQPEEAELMLRSALQQNWDDALVTLYGRIVGVDAGQQLIAAEGWLKERPNDANLLLALGRISLKNETWAKAREYLEASLRQLRTPEVYGELGRLCVALGDSERGAEYLSQSTVGLPDVPLPSGASAG